MKIVIINITSQVLFFVGIQSKEIKPQLILVNIMPQSKRRKKEYNARWYQDHKPYRARYMRVYRLRKKLEKAKREFREIRRRLEDKAAPVIAAHENIMRLEKLAFKIIGVREVI